MTRVLLCDADDCLFPSEGIAFVASTAVTNRLLAELDIDRRFEPDELRTFAAGRNFRATASALAAEHGVALTRDRLEPWVEEERREVVARLARELRPDPAVREPLERLAERHELAVVTSSALRRLAACLDATGLDDLFPHDRRFSAEDSLPAPASKPDPAVYAHAGARLDVTADEALAVEDSVSGVRSAVAAGFPAVGLLQFVGPDERAQRSAALRRAGVWTLADTWRAVEELTGDHRRRPPAPAAPRSPA